MMTSAAVLWIYCFWGNISTQPRMWYHRNTKANPFVGGTRLLWQKTWAQGFPITLADFLGLPDNPRLFHPTLSHVVLSVQFSHSVMSNSLWPHEPQYGRPPCTSPTLRVHRNSCPLSLGDAIQPSHPLSSPFPPALNLSHHQVFSNESGLRIRWPKYWRFSFSISPSSEYSRLISFRIDWLDLLAVQGTLKSLL